MVNCGMPLGGEGEGLTLSHISRSIFVVFCLIFLSVKTDRIFTLLL